MGIADDMMKQIMAEFERTGKQPGSLEEINRVAAIVNQRHNESPVNDFEGLSPVQMDKIIRFPFSEKCPVRFNPFLNADQLSGSKLLILAINLLDLSRMQNGLTLTPDGNLQRKVVQELYNSGLFNAMITEIHSIKVLNETDFIPLNLVHILLEGEGFLKATGKKLRITEKGHRGLSDKVMLFRELLKGFTSDFNKACFDAFPSEEIGNTGTLFALYLVSKYGDKVQNAVFYEKKYYTAFPMLRDPEDKAENKWGSLTVRVFVRGYRLFGLVEMIPKLYSPIRYDYNIKKTKLFSDALVIQ